MATQPTSWLRTAEVAAFVLGAALLFLHAAARSGLDAARDEAVVAFEVEHAPALPVVAAAGQIDRSAWSPQRVLAFDSSRNAAGRPEAVLRIPSLDLEVPVYEGTDELNLNRGAGHIEATAALGSGGNVGIAAHRDGFFRALERIRLDDVVVLDLGARELSYRVADIQVVEPTDVHVLADVARPAVTLVTCYPFYFLGSAPQRYIVRADLVDTAPTSAQRNNGREQTNQGEPR